MPSLMNYGRQNPVEVSLAPRAPPESNSLTEPLFTGSFLNWYYPAVLIPVGY